MEGFRASQLFFGVGAVVHNGTKRRHIAIFHEVVCA